MLEVLAVVQNPTQISKNLNILIFIVIVVIIVLIIATLFGNRKK